MGFPRVVGDKRIHLQCCRCKGHGFNPWVRKITWRRKWQPTPVFLPRESHEQRSLTGYSPWGYKELYKAGKHCQALSVSACLAHRSFFRPAMCISLCPRWQPALFNLFQTVFKSLGSVRMVSSLQQKLLATVVTFCPISMFKIQKP